MKRIATLALAATVLATSGCHMFSKKKNPSAPKESKTMATDVEKEFMARWIDKRTSDLTAQGLSADAAHAQAVAEFKVQYNYTDAAGRAK